MKISNVSKFESYIPALHTFALHTVALSILSECRVSYVCKMANTNEDPTLAWQASVLREQELAERLARAESEIARKNGTYFALIDDVFVGQIQNFANRNGINEGTYRGLCRTNGTTDQNFRNGEIPVKAYKQTADNAKETNDAADGQNSVTSSLHSSKKNLIWPTGLFAEAGNAGQIAHLVPASPDKANTHWFVTNFLFGFDRDRSWTTMKQLLHGAKPKNGNARKSHTGIKHCVANKLLLASQSEYFDAKPNVVIIPICTREFAKTWNGEGYYAIMLIDADPPDDPTVLITAARDGNCLLYTSPSPRDLSTSRMPSSA